jgi:acyl-CoA thioester hydrolase
MNEYKKEVQIRWSDLDPNFHLRHSVYYDWGALCRIEFLEEYGLTMGVMAQLKIGPIIFREECLFRKEIRMGDKISINLSVLKARQDFSRWSIQHHIIKDEGTLCAVLTVEGAWLDMVKRKLATPSKEVLDVFSMMPKSEGFEWI